MKQIIVNVSGSSVEEKQRVNEALAKIMGVQMCIPPYWNRVSAMRVSSPSVTVGFYYDTDENPTHTPQQVLEMAGMATSTDQHVFLADKFIITDSSGRIIYDGTLKSISSFMRPCVSAGEDGSLPSSDFSVKTDENGVAVMVPEQGHPHAHLMALYAEDAKTTDKPWELWQIKAGSSDWISCKFSPAWDPCCQFRRKPKTHIVNGVEVPDLRFEPKDGEEYYLPHPSVARLCTAANCGPYDSHYHRVSNNLCYEPTEEGKQAAIMHAKAWLGIA